MPVLLHLDSSPMGDQSISRHLTREFTRLWREANPGGHVIYRDITRIPIPIVDAEWVGANYTPRESRTLHQNGILALSTAFTQELLEAEEYVFGVPLHNWGPASSFKLWTDQIVHFGRTMQITPSGLKGMLDRKRLTVFMTAGRRYGQGLEDPSRNHLEPWLRTFFESLGIRNIRMVFVDGCAAVRRGEVDMAGFLAPHLASLPSLFAGASLA
jgi:FMN-dependent NADH-azoreductase